MANIPGTNVTAPIVPFTTNDIFASHLAKYGQGGWRTVDNLNDRDSIKELRRENLMVCAVVDDSYNSSTAGLTIYILDINHNASTSSSLIDNNNWIPLNIGSGDDWVLPPPPRSFYIGQKGQRSYDDDFIYICIQDNIWKRIAYDFFVDGVFDGATSGTSGVLPDGVVPIWDDGSFIYDLVVKNVQSTNSGLKITYSNDLFIYLPISSSTNGSGGSGGSGDNWILPPPISSATLGVEGQRSYDSDFLYICVEDNLWKRINLDLFLFTPSTSGNSSNLTLPDGVVPIWNDNTNFFEYGLIVKDTDLTEISGTSFINIHYSDNSSSSFQIGGSNVDSLNDLIDVTLNSPYIGESLVYNGSNWTNQVVTGNTSGGGASTLNQLLDVTITSAINGNILVYDNGQWINQAVNFNYNDYTTAGLASILYVDGLNNNLQSQIDSLNSATTGINISLSDIQTQINNIDTTGNDYTTAGLASTIYVDNSINSLIINDHTTAGYSTITYTDLGDSNLQSQIDGLNSATSGINTELILVDNRLDVLEANSIHSPDYTTAGLATISYVNSEISNLDFSGLYFGTNGLKNFSNGIGLGGSLIEDTTILSNGNNLSLQGRIASFYGEYGNSYGLTINNSGAPELSLSNGSGTELFMDTSKIDLLRSGVGISITSDLLLSRGTHNITLDGTNIAFNRNSMSFIIDGTNITATTASGNIFQIGSSSTIYTRAFGAGIEYAADYSIFYTDRSLVDRKFVIDSINNSTAGNLTFYNDYTTAGLATISYVDNKVINDLLDVDDSNRAINYVLSWSGSNWKASSVESVSGTNSLSFLNDLSDVTISTPLESQFLRYIGGEFINQTVEIKDHSTAGYLTNYNDYTTAGLATSIYTDLADSNLQSQIDDLNAATSGINTEINEIISKLDNSYYTSLNSITYNVTTGNPSNNNNLFSTSGSDIGSTIIAPNSLNIGDTFKISMFGHFTLENSTIASFRIKIGSATIASINNININSIRTNSLFKAEFIFTIRNIGISGAVIGQGYIDIGNGSMGVSNPLRFDLINTNINTIDTTISNEIKLEIDWDNSYQGNIVITNSKIEK